VPTNALQLVASLGFLILGLRLILRSDDPGAQASDDPTSEP
jgi:hypothetical protein